MVSLLRGAQYDPAPEDGIPTWKGIEVGLGFTIMISGYPQISLDQILGCIQEISGVEDPFAFRQFIKNNT
jgi:hypothetical protein